MNAQLLYNNAKVISIFETTLRLVQENGFHGTPMSKIALDADVAIGTIYHYFPSKDDLMIQLFAYCGMKFNASLMLNNYESLTYKEKFFKVWEEFVIFYSENQSIFSFYEQFHSSPYYDVDRVEVKNQLLSENKIIQFIQEGIDRGELQNLDKLAVNCVYLGSAKSLVKGMKYNKFKSNESILNVINIVWAGVKNN